jgi:threonine dehydrogenase-like Zn-dependent dehydrogenase
VKAAVFRGIGQIEVADVPQPAPDPGEVVIRVGYCGICGFDVESLVSREVTLDQVTEGFRLADTPGSGAVKITVCIGGET